ncbi:MAG: GAF domain-containing protein [Bacteroidales bacterium]|nr:GAF domain-containing protein [Bacteroidales bacterium]MBP5795270.1 GAF domain-containing protein [Bacteroidales bacterium]
MDRYECYIYCIREEMWNKLGENDFLADMSMITAYFQRYKYFTPITAFYRVVDDKLIIGPYQGDPNLKASFEYGEGVCGTAWKEKRAIVVPDPSTTETSSPYSSCYKTELAVPVWKKGKIIAILDICGNEGEDFNGENYDELDIFYIQNICNDLSCGIKPSLRDDLDSIACKEYEDVYQFDEEYWEELRDRALGIACRCDVDVVLVFALAASYFRKYERGQHIIGSDAAKALREDEELRELLTEPQIDIIAQALEDQDLPENQEPHTIYGKILADSRHQLDSYTVLTGCIRSLREQYPDLDREALWDKFLSSLDERYGPGGTFKLWLQESYAVSRLEQLQKFIADRTTLRTDYDRLLPYYD